VLDLKFIYILIRYLLIRSIRSSVPSIATRQTNLAGRSSNTDRGEKCFISSKCPDRPWGPSYSRMPPILLVPGSISRVKRKLREVTCSLPSSVEVKNEWSYTSKRLYAFMDSENFIFTINFFPPVLFILRESSAIWVCGDVSGFYSGGVRL
jgi:hypothetical protein